MLIFENDGILDLNALRIMGVSVKETASPIGFFGTGLKYAMATALRMGAKIKILIDGVSHEITSGEVEIRGEKFERVILDGEALGFTTSMGRHWEPWMCIRELLSNARDEGGKTYMGDLPSNKEGKTIIAIDHPDFKKVWENKANYFLDEDVAVYENDFCDFYKNTKTERRAVFYKGIRVSTMEGQCLFVYNFRKHMTLTEDRTLLWSWQATEAIEKALIQCDDEDLLHLVLTAPEGTIEHDFRFDHNIRPSKAFFAVCRRLDARGMGNIKRGNMGAIRLCKRFDMEGRKPKEVDMTANQEIMIRRSIELLSAIGYHRHIGSYPVVVVDFLGDGVLGKACDKTDQVYLAASVFDQGTKYVCSTLLEEYTHLETGYADNTREMQTHLFDRIITLGEQITGSPV